MSRRWAVLATSVVAACVLGFALITGFAAGPMALFGLVVLVPTLLLCVVLWYAAWAPRRRRELTPASDGSVVVDSPALLGWAVQLGWLSFPVLGLVAAFVLVADFSAVDSPGFLVVVAVAGLGGSGWAVGVLTGRVRRWRVVIDAEGLSYRALREETRLSWSEVAGTGIERKPIAGLRIHRRGAEPGPVLMAMVFTVPMDQVAEEIERRRRG